MLTSMVSYRCCGLIISVLKLIFLNIANRTCFLILQKMNWEYEKMKNFKGKILFSFLYFLIYCFFFY